MDTMHMHIIEPYKPFKPLLSGIDVAQTHVKLPKSERYPLMHIIMSSSPWLDMEAILGLLLDLLTHKRNHQSSYCCLFLSITSPWVHQMFQVFFFFFSFFCKTFIDQSPKTNKKVSKFSKFFSFCNRLSLSLIHWPITQNKPNVSKISKYRNYQVKQLSKYKLKQKNQYLL